jgi:hypothetical protein
LMRGTILVFGTTVLAVRRRRPEFRRVKVRFFGDTVVLVSVRGSARTFRIPNKKNRKLKIELYSWLLQKIQPTKSNSAEL